jgi:cold-inducible RNA-binding protein
MSNRLYVGNLPFHATDDVVRSAFQVAGEVTDVHVVVDRATGQSRGFAFVTMSTNEQAQAAITKLDGTNLEGRNLRVNIAEPRSNDRGPRGGGGGGGGGGGRGFGGGGGGGGGRGGFGGDRGGDRGGRRDRF